MFWVIFIVSDWILIKKIIVLSTSWETDFEKKLPGVLSGKLGHEEKCLDSIRFLGQWTS